MKKPTATVIGVMTKDGEAKPFPPLKLSGKGKRFIDCPSCGERLDKEDLGELLAHEQTCPGPSTSRPTGA